VSVYNLSHNSRKSKSWIVRRVRKLKSPDLVLCFDCTCGKLRDTQGVICLKLRIDMIS